MTKAVWPLLFLPLAACGSCGSCAKDKDDPAPVASASAGASAAGSASLSAEIIPRCRADGPRLTIDGEDVLVGDAAISGDTMLVGLVRRKGTTRMGAVLRTTLDLAKTSVIDVAPVHGDGAAPVPSFRDGKAWVSFNVRKEFEAGTTRGMRDLRITPLEESGVGAPVATITQQADESTLFDLAWPLVAWDEDALVPEGKFIPERGVVKVQALPDGKAHVVSPEGTDAESPKLARKKGGGFWLAWLARKQEVEDAGYRLEGAGELRAWHWVEIVALDANGDPTGQVKRVSPDKGHAVSFDLLAGDGDPVLVVQDEGASSEGAGARVVRYSIADDKLASSEIVDGGIGHALAEVIATEDAGWLAWKDTSDRSWIAPASPSVVLAGPPSAESAFDGARVLAGVGSTSIYVTSGSELRRFNCRK